MSGDIITSSGARIYLGGAVTEVQSDTLVEFLAMSNFVEIELVESIAPFGDKANVVTFAAINDSRMRKSKGIRDAGDFAVVVAHDPTATGQAAVRAAQGTSSSYAVKILLPDLGATAYYFRALVLDNPIDIGANDHVVRRTFNFAINGAIYTDE